MVKALTAALMMCVICGCTATREPKVVIHPTYTFTDAEPQLSADQIWPVPTQRAARVAVLPPLPPAPGFEANP